MVLSIPTIAFAAEGDVNHHSDSDVNYQQERISLEEQAQIKELSRAQAIFEGMSIEKLNCYIDTTIERINQRSSEAKAAPTVRALVGLAVFVAGTVALAV